MSSNYTAIITRVKVRPHPNADRLQLAICHGSQVVLGLDTQDDELGIFYPTGGQLSHENCLHNNLYTASARTKLGLTEGLTGFICHKRRVRAQRFRGTPSDGLWLPLDSLSWTGVDLSGLREGDTIAELGGYQLATKYLTPATLRALKGQSPKRQEIKTFPKHDVTKQYRFYAGDIPENSIVWITEKLHGTQGRLAHCLDEVQLGRVKKAINWAANKLNVQEPFPTQIWVHLNGSKNVIIEKSAGPGYYGTNKFRFDVVHGITLRKGEAIYFEIVGWVVGDEPCGGTLTRFKEWYYKVPPDHTWHTQVEQSCKFCIRATPIMPPHNVSSTNLTEIKQQYGDTINYTYGCPAGQHRMYVYKIMQFNEDGIGLDLPWHQVVQRCQELGLPTVPVLAGPFVIDSTNANGIDIEELSKRVDLAVEGPSILNPKQIREGGVVRVESSVGKSYLKSKYF